MMVILDVIIGMGYIIFRINFLKIWFLVNGLWLVVVKYLENQVGFVRINELRGLDLEVWQVGFIFFYCFLIVNVQIFYDFLIIKSIYFYIERYNISCFLFIFDYRDGKSN